MSQVAVRTIVAIGGGITLRNLITGWLAYLGVKELGTVINQQFLLVIDTVADQLVQVGTYAYYLACIYILLELRGEIAELVRLVGSSLYWLLAVLQRWHFDWSQTKKRQSTDACEPDQEADHWKLTCLLMAHVEGFLLIERSGEWDEVFSTGVISSGSQLLVRTTSGDGSQWIWALVEIVPAAIKIPVGAGVGRTAPAGVAAGTINWICPPENLAQKWAPTQVEIAALKQEAQLLGLQIQRQGVQNLSVHVPGSGVDIVPLNLGAVAPGGVSGQALPGAVGGLGPVGGEAPGSSGPDHFNMQALADVVRELKDMSKKNQKDKKDKKHKKKDKKSKKSRSKKKKKKKKKKRSSSSQSSTSSRSRSSRSSSSSSSGSSTGPLRWEDRGKSKKIKYDDVHAVDAQKFKRKGELLAYATKHPGALSAHFLASIYARLSRGSMTKSSQLREANVVQWATQHSGLSEIRDVREVLTLAECMDSINRREISRAMDVLAQRILAVQQAKRKGGSWEKAEAIELVPSGASLASSSMLALTN